MKKVLVTLLGLFGARELCPPCPYREHMWLGNSQ